MQGRVEGHEQLQGHLQASLGGLSNVEITELHCFTEDDVVVYPFEMATTHQGELLEVPATGNRIEITTPASFRVIDGRITDEWPRTAMLGLPGGIGLVDLPFRGDSRLPEGSCYRIGVCPRESFSSGRVTDSRPFTVHWPGDG